MLAMLAGALRGLPGASIDRVALQQANAGYPLDDVIIHGHDNISGKVAVLGSSRLSGLSPSPPSDPIGLRRSWAKIVKASQRPDFQPSDTS